MVSILGELEMQAIDGMSRSQLLEAIGPRRHCLPPDLRNGLDSQPTERLGLMLLAARLINVLRLLHAQDLTAGASRELCS
jgi:hypothetical protein